MISNVFLFALSQSLRNSLKHCCGASRIYFRVLWQFMVLPLALLLFSPSSEIHKSLTLVITAASFLHMCDEVVNDLYAFYWYLIFNIIVNHIDQLPIPTLRTYYNIFLWRLVNLFPQLIFTSWKNRIAKQHLKYQVSYIYSFAFFCLVSLGILLR